MFGNSNLARQIQDSENPFDGSAIPQESLLEDPFGQAMPAIGDAEPQSENPFDVPIDEGLTEPASSDPLPGEAVEKPENVNRSTVEEPFDTQPLQEPENKGGMPKLPSEQHEGPIFDIQSEKQGSSENETTKIGQPDAFEKSPDASYANLPIWIYFLPIAFIILGVVVKRWLAVRAMKAQGFSKLNEDKVPQQQAENFRVGNSLKSSPAKPVTSKFKTRSNKSKAESQTEPAPAFSDALLDFSDSTVLNPEDFSDLGTSDESQRMPVGKETATASQPGKGGKPHFNFKPDAEFEDSVAVSSATVIHARAAVSESGTVDLGQLAQMSEPDAELNDDDFDFSKANEEAKGEVNSDTAINQQASEVSENLIGSQYGSDEFEFDFSEDEEFDSEAECVAQQAEAENDFPILGSNESPSQLDNNTAFDDLDEVNTSTDSEASNDDSAIFDSGELEFDLSEDDEELDFEIEDAFDMETKATEMEDGLAGNLDSETPPVETQEEHENKIELPAANTVAAGAAIAAEASGKICGSNSGARIQELESELSRWKENAAKFESEAGQLTNNLKKLEQDSESEGRRAEELAELLEKRNDGLAATEAELTEFKSKLETAEQSLKDAQKETQAELDKNKCEIVELKSKLATAEQSLEKASKEPQAKLAEKDAELVELKSKLETTEQSLKDSQEEAQTELDKRGAENAELKSKLETAEQSLKNASEKPQTELAEKDAEITELKSKLETVEQSLKDATEEAQAELDKRGAENAELKSKLETTEQFLKNTSEKPQTELAEKDAEISELKSKLETVEQSFKGATEEAQAELSKLGAENAELTSKLKTTEQSLKNADEKPQTELVEKDAEISELKHKLETAEQSLKDAKEETQTALAENESKASELESKLAAAGQQIEAAQTERAELKSQLETATANLENRKEDSSLAEELARSKKELADAMSKKNALKSKLRMLLVKFEKQKNKQVKVDPDETGVLISGPKK